MLLVSLILFMVGELKMSFDYESYRKKIDNFFISDLDKAETKIMKKILFIITKQKDLDSTIRNATLFCDKTHTHIKFLNAAHYFNSILKGSSQNVLSLQEIITTLESSEIENSELVVIKERSVKDPFSAIMEIIDASQVNLIIVQYPFSDTILNEKPNENNLGSTIEAFLSFSLTKSKIPLLILKNNTLIEEGINHVVMAGTDWINDYAFNTLIHLSNALHAKLTLLPFIKESSYKESEIANKVMEVTKEVEKFTKEANEWLTRHKINVSIEKGPITKNRFEFLDQLFLLHPDMVALYVPRKFEVVESFTEIVRKAQTNIIIVPELV